MSVLSASIQLDLEKVLKSFLEAQIAGLAAHPAHALEPSASPDCLSIIAGLPDWEHFSGEGAVIPVTFQLCTGVADPDTRAAQVIAHQDRLGAILELFTYQNCVATKAALDAINSGLGFNGWEASASNDGQSPETKQLAPDLNFIFEVFLRAV